MQRKTFTQAALALAATLVLAPAAMADTIKLTLGHGAAPGNPRHEASVKFAEIVKAKTGGRIEVQVSPSAQLGDDAGEVQRDAACVRVEVAHRVIPSTQSCCHGRPWRRQPSRWPRWPFASSSPSKPSRTW